MEKVHGLLYGTLMENLKNDDYSPPRGTFEKLVSFLLKYRKDIWDLIIFWPLYIVLL